MLRIAWFGEKIDQKNILKILPPPQNFRWQAKIVTTIFFFLEKNEKNEKCLEFSDLARKLIRKTVRQFHPPRHVRRKISAGVDGGPSGGSSVCRPGIIDSIVIWHCYVGTIQTALIGTIRNALIGTVRTGKVGTLHISCMSIVVYTHINLCVVSHIFPLIEFVMSYQTLLFVFIITANQARGDFFLIG